jgi:2-haloacid dehalogenase
MDYSAIKALVFDVFGTVVDWRGTVIEELDQLGKARGFTADWGKFADTWRDEGYLQATQRVRRVELPWMNVDQLHHRMLEELLVRFGIEGLSETEKDHLNRVWHRLKPWPDAIEGLTRLRKRYTLATLSNGNMALLTNMAKYVGLPWDCILSSELIMTYKPEYRVYQMAADLLGLPPSQVMMVSAHKKYDLPPARTIGMRTAFTPRPKEWGLEGKGDYTNEPWIDIYANDFLELATKLGT